EEDVDRTEARDGLRMKIRQRGRVSAVPHDGDEPILILILRTAAGLIREGLPIDHRDARALREEPPCRRGADPVRGSRDRDGLAGETLRQRRHRHAPQWKVLPPSTASATPVT